MRLPKILLIVLALGFFLNPLPVSADEFSGSVAINDFFKDRQLDSIEGIWRWETAAGYFEGAMINVDKLQASEKIRKQYGKNIQYVCLLTKASRGLPPGTLVIALNPSSGGVHRGYYITYGCDYYVGYGSNEIPFSVSPISENTLAFGTKAPDGGEIFNEAKRVYPTGDSISYSIRSNSGTGFFISPNILVTAYSNIAEAKTITLSWANGLAGADVLVRDRTNDLALLHVKSPDGLLQMGQPIPIGNVRDVNNWDPVFCPLFDDETGTLEMRLVEGKILSTTGERNDPRVFEVDIPSGKMRNGAPVLNASFQVIGILIDIGNNPYFQNKAMVPEGISYAAKINNLFNLAASVRECPRLEPGEPDSSIDELTVFNSVGLIYAEGVK